MWEQFFLGTGIRQHQDLFSAAGQEHILFSINNFAGCFLDNPYIVVVFGFNLYKNCLCPYAAGVTIRNKIDNEKTEMVDLNDPLQIKATNLTDIQYVGWL